MPPHGPNHRWTANPFPFGYCSMGHPDRNHWGGGTFAYFFWEARGPRKIMREPFVFEFRVAEGSHAVRIFPRILRNFFPLHCHILPAPFSCIFRISRIFFRKIFLGVFFLPFFSSNSPAIYASRKAGHMVIFIFFPSL